MLIKWGAGIVDGRGSIAGMTASRNKSGSYIRARVKPVNPKSPRQEAARTIVSFLAEMWHADLNNVERGLWETYAAAIAMKNGLGESIHLSGFNHFLRSNAVEMGLGFAAVNAAPTILSLPEKDTDLVCSEEDIAGQTFTFTCNVNGWFPNGDDKKTRMPIYMGQPQLVSRQTYQGPWRYMHYIDHIEGAAGTGTMDAPYSFALGQKVWFRARIVTQSARVSEIWQLDPRDIIADV